MPDEKRTAGSSSCSMKADEFSAGGKRRLYEKMLKRQSLKIVLASPISSKAFFVVGNKIFSTGRDSSNMPTPLQVSLPEGELIKQFAISEYHDGVIENEWIVTRYGRLYVRSPFLLEQDSFQRVILPNDEQVGEIHNSSTEPYLRTLCGKLYMLRSSSSLGDDCSRIKLERVLIPNEELVKCGHTTIGGGCFILTQENKLYAWKDNIQRHVQLLLVRLPDNKQVERVFCGESHAFALSNDNTLFGVGDNDLCQLGCGDNQNRNMWQKIDIPNNEQIEQVIAPRDNSFMLTRDEKGDNKLYACGENRQGQLGLGDNQNKSVWQKINIPNDEQIEQIISSGDNSFILTRDNKGKNKLYACGENRLGQLGLGNSEHQNLFQQIKLPEQEIPSGVITNGVSTFVTSTTDKIYACGGNLRGVLAVGDNEGMHCSPLPIKEQVFKEAQLTEELKIKISGILGKQPTAQVLGSNDRYEVSERSTPKQPVAIQKKLDFFELKNKKYASQSSSGSNDLSFFSKRLREKSDKKKKAEEEEKKQAEQKKSVRIVH
jgi:hypothetical protein